MTFRMTAIAAFVLLSGISMADAGDPLPQDTFVVDKDTGVCEAFGAGYARLPGTSTCIRVSGYVWSQVGVSSGSDRWQSDSRARLQFDSRTDTEWGELAGRLRIQGTVGDRP